MSESSVTIDNAERCAIWAMSRHTSLAIPAIGTVTGSVNFANNALANQGRGRSCSRAFMHRFDNTHKFMTQHALEGHVATYDLQIGVTNTCQQDTYQGFAFHKSRIRILR